MFHKSKKKTQESERNQAIKSYSDYVVHEIDTPNILIDLYTAIGSDFSDISSSKERVKKTLDMYFNVILSVTKHYVSQGDFKRCYDIWEVALPKLRLHGQYPSYFIEIGKHFSYAMGYNVVQPNLINSLDDLYRLSSYTVSHYQIYKGIIAAALDNGLITKETKSTKMIDNDGIKFLISKFTEKHLKLKFIGYWLAARNIPNSQYAAYQDKLLRLKPNSTAENLVSFANKFNISFLEASRGIRHMELYKITDLQAKGLMTNSALVWFLIGEEFMQKVIPETSASIPLDVYLLIASYLTQLDLTNNKAIYNGIQQRRKNSDALKSHSNESKPGFFAKFKNKRNNEEKSKNQNIEQISPGKK